VALADGGLVGVTPSNCYAKAMLKTRSNSAPILPAT
jgi:hypothetical protein